MIKLLKLKNFVLFEEQEVIFKDGTNVLIGETGAGKSLIFSAISVLSGQRNNSKLIMNGKNFYELEMVLDISKLNKSTLKKVVDLYNIKDIGAVTVYRKLSKDGKSETLIADNKCTLNELSDFTSEVISIYYQDNSLEYFKEENHINIIDELIDPIFLNEYQEVYSKYTKQKELVEILNKQNNQKEEKLEILNLQLENLKKINDLEDEEYLENQRKKILNLNKIEEQNKIIDEEFLNINNSLKNIILNISDELVEEKLNDIKGELENIGFSYAKVRERNKDISIEEVEEKLSYLKRLKRKYNLDYSGLVEKLDFIKKEIDNLENISITIVKEEKTLNTLLKEVKKRADILTKNRKTTIVSFAKTINTHFEDLKMSNANLEIIIDEANLNYKGQDDIKIMIRTNKGYNHELINRVLSGGERSRIMLIFKIALNSFNPKLVYLLDEIDQGISSEVASKLGDKVRIFSQDVQSILISHTVQVISKMDNLYNVQKFEEEERNLSKIEEVKNKEEVLKVFLKY